MSKSRQRKLAKKAQPKSSGATNDYRMADAQTVVTGKQVLNLEPGDCFDWSVKLKLPSLAKLFIRPKYKERSFGEKAPSRRGFLDEVGGYGDAPTPAARRALSYLAENEAAICAKVLRAVADDCNEFRKASDSSNFDDPPGIDAVMPRGMTPDQAAERIWITRVAVTTEERDGMAYLEVQGECAWDPDHGFEVVLHGDRLVGVFQQGTGWVDRRPRKPKAKKRAKR